MVGEGGEEREGRGVGGENLVGRNGKERRKCGKTGDREVWLSLGIERQESKEREIGWRTKGAKGKDEKNVDGDRIINIGKRR